MTLDRLGVVQTSAGEEIVASADGRIVSLTAALGEAGAGLSTRSLIARWPRLGPLVRDALADDSLPALDRDALDWRPPIIPAKFLCVGANYRDHVEEMERAGAAPSVETDFPFSFLKPPTNTMVGSGTAVAIPAFGEKLDWEAELAIVIGDPTKAVDDPLAAVFGYTILNELSLRDFVAPFPHPLGLDAVISKGFDGAAPIGPWITLAERVGDPGSIPIETRVNGVPKQQSSTEQMIFTVPELISFYAEVLTLEPGDVIATGTPAGVGAGKQPPEFLAAGDVVEVEIGDLGTLRTPIEARRGKSSLAVAP